MKLNSSATGFLCSLCIHGLLFGSIAYFLFSSDDSANGYQAPIGTHISMEMLKGMVKATPQPEANPESVIEEKVVERPAPKPAKKEIIADPTVKKAPIKKKEINKEEPKKVKKEKPKNKSKVKKVKKKETRQGNKNINSKDKVNSVASNTSQANSNNPNLIGKGSNIDALAAYKSALRHAIERRKRYPQRAKLMRKQGTVVVAFSIAKNGDLSNIRVEKSSNNSDLDRAAIKAVKGVRSIGPRPLGLQENISVPINFRIH